MQSNASELKVERESNNIRTFNQVNVRHPSVSVTNQQLQRPDHDKAALSWEENVALPWAAPQSGWRRGRAPPEFSRS